MARHLLNFVFLSLIAHSAWADHSHDTLIERDLSFVDKTIVPGYRSLAQSTETLHQVLQQNCKSGHFQSPEVVQAFHTVVDDWQFVQWLRSGPADFLFRHARFQMWPDKHNTASRQYRKVIQEMDYAVLEHERFREGSVAIQGLPAMERMLFSNSDIENGSPRGERTAFTCAFLITIATNLREIAAELKADWSGFYRESIVQAGAESAFFDSALGPTREWLSQLSAQLEIIKVLKLKRPLGYKNESTKIRHKRAESWRSERSIKNIQINLRALHQVYKQLFAPMIHSDALSQQLSREWNLLVSHSEDLLPGFLNAVQDKPTALIELIHLIDEVLDLINEEFAQDVGLSIGFNSLDGD